MVKESINQSAIRVSCGGVNHKPGGFVDDENVAVLKKDFDGDVLSNDFDGGDFRNGEGDEVAHANDGTRLCWLGIETTVVRFDKVLKAGAGMLGKATVEEAVEAFPGILGLVGSKLKIGHGQ